MVRSKLAADDTGIEAQPDIEDHLNREIEVGDSICPQRPLTSHHFLSFILCSLRCSTSFSMPLDTRWRLMRLLLQNEYVEAEGERHSTDDIPIW